ncbi:hypothetical protein [Nocardia gipuzkoensis]
MAVVIAHAADIVAWMEANLPELDPDRFEPWVVEPPVPGRPPRGDRDPHSRPRRRERVLRIEVSATPIQPTDS